MAEEFDAVVLVGGGGRRLGGVDKGGLVVAGVPLLDRVLLAAAGARHTVVVGEPRPTTRPVTWAREDPPGGGPLAGLAAGLSALAQLTAAEPGESAATRGESAAVPGESAAVPGAMPSGGAVNDAESDARELPVMALATDLPWLRPEDLARLLTALNAAPTADAAMFSDRTGHLQPLTAVYRIRPIRVALAAVEPVHAKPVKLVLHALTVVTVPDLGAAGDCDTPEQLAAVRAHYDRQG